MKKLILILVLMTILTPSTQAQVSVNEGSYYKEANSGATCEWNPVVKIKQDFHMCKTTDLGVPAYAVFECGLTDTCKEKCIFKECSDLGQGE